jgi:hypothetical protein
MAIVDKNSLLASVHGSVGNAVVVHQKKRIIFRNKPVVSPKKTRARRTHQTKFGRASKWASGMLKGAPEVAAVYIEAVRGTDWSAQQLAISDAMNSPGIDEVDVAGYTGCKGEKILVQANAGVNGPIAVPLKSVRVEIRNLSGALLEQGPATAGGAAWEYLTREEMPPTELVKIHVTVEDYPGNTTTKAVPHLTRTQA